MTYVVEQSVEVVLDLAYHYEIINAEEPDAAEDFLVSVQELIDRLRSGIVRFREIDAAMLGGLSGVYAATLGRRFRSWYVPYTIDGSRIKVLAVLHSAMSEDHIQELLSFRTDDAQE